MTAADIQQLCTAAKEQGVEIRVSPTGAVLIRPLDMERRGLTSTERSRARRARLRVASEPGNATDATDATDATLQRGLPSPSLPPPPLSPTPPIPAPAHTPPPADARASRMREEADFAAASAHTLDMTASPKLREAWAQWQVYRQRRHRQTGQNKLPWTLQAARLSANLITRAADTHGEQIVTDRIATAIAGNWQGLNFDKLQTNGNPHQPTGPRFAATTNNPNRAPDGDSRQKASKFDV